ncbi:MAG: phosphatidylserine/phosphatidylglycerophosphate/cardiolipin synthase family protein [Armatimonadetes bacterium]|nr:phosphatidylserine/phosphatidylglycerophosphate/cardiolipin synthase family protein [Armatimonadota bacterium]
MSSEITGNPAPGGSFGIFPSPKGIRKTKEENRDGEAETYVPSSDAEAEELPPWYLPGNKVTPLFDERVTPKDDSDDIFTQVKKSISGAKKTIQIEMFDLQNKDVVDLLIKEAKKGIKVQVIMDPPNEDWEESRKEVIEKLSDNGVKVLTYPAKEPGSPGAKYGQLCHVKMLLVDGDQAIIGGMNWGNHSPLNHDFDVKVEGPAVDKMKWIFREDWLKSGGQSGEIPYIGHTPAHPDANATVNVVTSSLEAKEQTIQKAILHSIDDARESIHAELFVLSSRPAIEALKSAHERGVDVRVILHPLKIKGNAINEKAFNELKEAGVPVKWYECDSETGEKLHAKMAVFDEDKTIVGSANWSYAGFKTNREANVEILAEDVNSSFEKVFQKDWKTKTADTPTYLEDIPSGTIPA